MEEEENNKPQLPLVPANLAPNTIKLSDLIDFAVQQVFHEITVLSELLPKKMDGDRKVSLVQFAHNTRMLFVKLLALVKWVKSSKKFEQCTAISYFLEQQGQLLLDSADRLFHIREEMTYARLPPFQLSEAVDTLTLGNYARVPTCIKEAFVKKTKLTAGEQGKVLGRLNQIIHTRLSRESMKMSPRIKDIRIRNGHVTLVVPGEFEVQLTVLGDKIGMPWTLLNIKMLVEDYEIGYGSQLVHPLQLNRIHLELQKRLEEWQEQKQDPLANLYKFLHRFAQSLQLDVLWCQATQIGGHDGQYAERIMIEKYDSKERILTIGYWLKRIYLRPGSSQFRVTSEYRISIMGTDDDGPLKVVHSPAYPGLGTLDDRSGRLSVDRLLADTLVVRARERLLRIRKRIEAAEPKMPIAFLGQAVPYLRMPLLKDSMTNPHECLSVSISLYSGKVLCDLIALNQKERAELQALEKMLYDCPPVDTLRKQFSKFKVKVMIERIKKAITTLQVKLVSESQMSPFLQNLISLPAERVFLQFAREEYYYVIVTFDPREDLTLKLGFHLLSLVEDKAQLLDLTELPQVFASLKKVIHLEALEYQEGDVYEKLLHERRRLTSQEKQLICGIAAVDDRLGILRIKQELEKRGIQNIAVDEEKEIGGMVVNIANLANIPEVKSQDFANHVHRCSIRLDSRGRGAWLLELTMGPPPLYRNKREGAQRPVRSTFITDMKGSVADNGGIAPVIIDRLVTYSNIFDIVKKFARVYERFYKDKCTILAFTYHKLVLSYGTERDMLLTVTFQSKSPQQQQSDIAQPFKLAFGCVKKGFAETDRANPHTLMAAELTRRFNKTHDLLELINHLVLTLEPMVLIHNYHRTRLISVRPYCYAMNLSDVTFPMIMKGGITVINRYTVRLTYGDIHLEIAMLMDNRIAIRDSSRGTPKAAGLVDRVIFAEEEKGQTYIVPDPTEYESAIVNNMIGCNVPIPTHTLAVATPKTEGNSPREQRSPAAQNLNHLVGSRNVFTTSLSTFKKVMKWEPVEGKTRQQHCVLDDHLNYLCFIQRVANLMEQFKNGQGHQSICNGLQIKDVYRDVDHVKVVFPSVGSSSSMVSFHLFLDKCTWCLRVKINYTESEPSEENLSTLEEYAQRKVVETWNEMAVCSFLMLLRLTPYQGVDAIASFLKTPNIIFPMACKVNLSNEKPSWKYGTGFLVQDINIQFLVCFVQSPPPQDAYFPSPNPPVPQKKVFCVSYNWETNLLKLTTQNQSAAPNPEDAVFEQINKDAVAKNISAVFTFLNFYNEKFCGNAPQQLPPMPNYSTASVISLDSSTMNPGSNLLY